MSIPSSRTDTLRERGARDRVEAVTSRNDSAVLCCYVSEGNRAAVDADRFECAFVIMTMQNGRGGMGACYKGICSAVGFY